MSAIGDWLRTLRMERGMSQDELATASGVAQAIISRIERGETADPGIGTVRRLTDALGVSLEGAPIDEATPPPAGGPPGRVPRKSLAEQVRVLRQDLVVVGKVARDALARVQKLEALVQRDDPAGKSPRRKRRGA